MLYDNDFLLLPYKGIIEERHRLYQEKARLLQGGAPRLSDNCNSHLYYGLHFTEGQWKLREWAPNASAMYLLFEGNSWQKNQHYAFQRVSEENWELC